MSLAKIKRRSGGSNASASQPAEGDPDSDHVSVAKINRHGRQGTSRWYKSEHKRQHGGGKDAQTGGFLPWFHGLISRKQAEELLSTMPVGSFLVRVSESRFAYVLSVHGHGKMLHYMIEQNQQGLYGLSAWAKSEDERFIRDPLCRDLQQVVEAYRKEPVNPNTPLLATPCCHDEAAAQQIVTELLEGDEDPAGYALADAGLAAVVDPKQGYDMADTNSASAPNVNFGDALYDLGSS